MAPFNKFGILVVALLLALVAGEAAYWRVAATQLRTGYKAWLAAQASRGWDIGSGPVSIGGWPGSASITMPNLAVRHARPTMPGNVDVAAAGVTLAVSLFNPTALDLSLTGPMHVRVATLPDVIVTGDAPTVSVPLRRAGPLSVALHASGLRVEAATGAWHVTIGLLNAHAELSDMSTPDRSRPGVAFTMSSEAIALPAGVKWPLGQNVSSLSVDGSVSGALPATRDITQWAEAWRDGGGSVEITHLTLGWGPLGLTAAGTLGLDDQLQPKGRGNARIVGYGETLDRLAVAGMLRNSAATAAKAVLSLMAGTSDTDQPASVEVPLTLQNRTLSMLQVPLLRLPEVDWPPQ